MEENKIALGALPNRSPVLRHFYTAWQTGQLCLGTEKQFLDFMGFIYTTGRSDLAKEYDEKNP